MTTASVASPALDERVLTIEGLGAHGHGVAHEAGRAVFVPGALPGERVLVRGQGEAAALVDVLAPSAERIVPFCPLFGACGGCAVQHWAPSSYAAWKRGLVVEALSRAGIAAPVADLVDGHGAGRRRVTLHGRRTPEGATAGFMRARSHELIEVDACPILEPALAPAPKLAKAISRALAGSGKPLTILITATTGGLDVDVRGHGPAGERQRISLTGLANQLDLARLSMHGDVIVARREAAQRMGKALVTVPPGGFLQPTRLGEERLAALAGEAVAGARRVADLFAGSGPFALRLAETSEVHAVESELSSLAALDRAARATPGLRRVTIEPRDLFRRPLLPQELMSFEAVVIDPPRAGAEAQVAQLAGSAVPRIAYISCDVGTFARDAARLIAGGYALERVTPVDQFRHSHHVELVGSFTRPARRKR